jgi:hypothetical protein
MQRLLQTLRRRAVVGGTSRKAPDGSLFLLGDGVAAGAFLSSVRPIDLVPTLLYGLGIPIARDLDGQVITAAFEQSFLATHPLQFVPSYGTVVQIDDPPPSSTSERSEDAESSDSALRSGSRRPRPRNLR